MAEEKDLTKRSDCPLSRTLEWVGDKWTLLILRDMLFFGKSTYNEFMKSPEKIASNILNDRLKKMTALGIITYTGSTKRKKYMLTERGLDLKPVLESVARFGMKYFEGSQEYLEEQMRQMRK